VARYSSWSTLRRLKIDKLSIANRYVMHRGASVRFHNRRSGLRLNLNTSRHKSSLRYYYYYYWCRNWQVAANAGGRRGSWNAHVLYNNVICPAGDRTQPARYSNGLAGRRRRHSSKIKLSRRMYRDANNRPPPADDLWYRTHTRTARVFIDIYSYIFFSEPPLVFQTCPVVTNSRISSPAAKFVTPPAFKTMRLRWNDDNVVANDARAFQKHSTRSHSPLYHTHYNTIGHPFTDTLKISTR